MTLISLQDGKVVMRDGKVGTEQECCCTNCRCDQYRYLCHEYVYSIYSFAWTAENAAGDAIPDDIPTEQPEGTILVVAGGANNQRPGAGCPGTTGIQQTGRLLNSTYCYIDNPCTDADYDGQTAYRWQRYARFRVVDSCDDCATNLTYAQGTDLTFQCDGYEVVLPTTCPVGIVALSCAQITQEMCQASEWQDCLAAAGVNICANPLP